MLIVDVIIYTAVR